MKDKEILDALNLEVERLVQLHGPDYVGAVLMALGHLEEVKEGLQRVGGVTLNETIHLGHATVKVLANPWEGKLEIHVILPTGPKNA